MRIHYFFVYQVGKLRFGMHIVHVNWNPMICIFVGQLPKGPRNGPCLGLKAPTCKNFFIYQDREFKFCMHIAHTKTNTMIYICVGVTPLRAAKRPLNAAEGGAA